MRSMARPSRIATHASQVSHGSPSWRFVQFSALARIRASDVLPVPRGPTNRTACDTRSERTALRSVSTTAVWPTISENRWARQRRYSAWWGTAVGVLVVGWGAVGLTALLRSWAGGVGRRPEDQLPCTHRRPVVPRALPSERLGPGRSAAPDDDRLVLLP